jgi:hypothetical protein
MEQWREHNWEIKHQSEQLLQQLAQQLAVKRQTDRGTDGTV